MIKDKLKVKTFHNYLSEIVGGTVSKIRFGNEDYLVFTISPERKFMNNDGYLIKDKKGRTKWRTGTAVKENDIVYDDGETTVLNCYYVTWKYNGRFGDALKDPESVELSDTVAVEVLEDEYFDSGMEEVIDEAYHLKEIMGRIVKDAEVIEHNLKCLKATVDKLADETDYEFQETYLRNILKYANTYNLGSITDRNEIELGIYAVKDCIKANGGDCDDEI